MCVWYACVLKEEGYVVVVGVCVCVVYVCIGVWYVCMLEEEGCMLVVGMYVCVWCVVCVSGMCMVCDMCVSVC
jgi:hypothetical protein